MAVRLVLFVWLMNTSIYYWVHCSTLQCCCLQYATQKERHHHDPNIPSDVYCCYLVNDRGPYSLNVLGELSFKEVVYEVYGYHQMSYWYSSPVRTLVIFKMVPLPLATLLYYVLRFSNFVYLFG